MLYSFDEFDTLDERETCGYADGTDLIGKRGT